MCAERMIHILGRWRDAADADRAHRTRMRRRLRATLVETILLRAPSPHRIAHAWRLPMFKRLVVLCALGALLPLSALAQGPVVSDYGLRAGFSVDPDQL